MAWTLNDELENYFGLGQKVQIDQIPLISCLISSTVNVWGKDGKRDRETDRKIER